MCVYVNGVHVSMYMYYNVFCALYIMYACTYVHICMSCMSHQYMYSCNIYAQITLHLLTSVQQIYVAS